MRDQFSELFSHPYITSPIAAAAALNPWWMDFDTVLSRTAAVLGIIYLGITIYYALKNKGKK